MLTCRRSLSMLFLLLLFSASLPARADNPPLPSLLTRATKVLTRKDWQWDPKCEWLTNDQILMSRSPDPHGRVKETFYRYDLRSRRETSLTALNKQIADYWRNGDWQLSPNKQYLFNAFMNAILRLDGTGLRNVPAGGLNSEDTWLGDSMHFLNTFCGTTGNLLYYFDIEITSTRKSEKSVPLTNSKRNPLYSWETLEVSSYGNRIFTLNAQSAKPNLYGMGKEDVDRVIIYSRDMRRPRSRSRQTIIKLPGKGTVSFTAFSPRCDRVAFLYIPKSKRSISLWICRTNGQNMHMVGTIQGTFSEWDYSSKTSPCSLRWKPDGKHLSFVYKDALYTVPST